YGQLGALTRASQAADRAAGGAGVKREELDAIRLALAHDRLTLGLPADAEKVKLAPEREPAYAERYRAAADLLGAGKVREARVAVTAALREFPAIPGMQVVACEVELRQSHARSAGKLT